MLSPEQWRVTLIKVRPRLIGLTVFVVGLIIGLAWAYGVAPTIWQNAGPVNLSDSFQAEWVKLVALQYTETNDPNLARDMLGQVGDPGPIIQNLITQNQNDRELVGRLTAVQNLAQPNPNVLAQVQYGGLQTMSPIVLVILIFLVGAFAIVFWGMYGLTLSMIIKGLLPRRRRGTADEDAAASQASAREQERRRAAEAAVRQREAEVAIQTQAGLPPPVSQFMSAYIIGDDYFDDSFSIEDASGGFLGETGAGISETVGVGAPKKVSAIEIWLFDKNDIRTVTKVLMSEHAYNDEAMRAKLAPKGEAVLAQPGAQVQLETQTLRIIATVRDMAYGTGAQPPNSFFDRLTIDIAAYAKEGATSAPGTAIGDMYGGTMPIQ